MPWCPKCKNEYYEGIAVCADCGSELIDSLEEWERAEREAKETERLAQIAAFRAMMEQEEACGEATESLEAASYFGNAKEDGGEFGFGDADGFEGEDRFGDAASFEDAKDVGNAGSVKQSEKTPKNRAAEHTFRGVYQNYEEKAADNKSSAYTLLGVGAVGVAVVILAFLDVITLPLYSSTKYIVLSVMGAMFLFFVVMGIISMKNAGKYAKKAELERELTGKLEKWFADYVTVEKIDEGLFTEEEADFSEEQKYFKRFDRMKELLSERFMNLNEGYVDRFLDKHYQDIFGDKELLENNF